MITAYPEALGAAMLVACNRKGFKSQDQIADALRVNQTTVCRMMAGKAPMDLRVLDRAFTASEISRMLRDANRLLGREQ